MIWYSCSTIRAHVRELSSLRQKYCPSHPGAQTLRRVAVLLIVHRLYSSVTPLNTRASTSFCESGFTFVPLRLTNEPVLVDLAFLLIEARLSIEIHCDLWYKNDLSPIYILFRSSIMISDMQLGIMANILGISKLLQFAIDKKLRLFAAMFVLVILYHYINVNYIMRGQSTGSHN